MSSFSEINFLRKTTIIIITVLKTRRSDNAVRSSYLCDKLSNYEYNLPKAIFPRRQSVFRFLFKFSVKCQYCHTIMKNCLICYNFFLLACVCVCDLITIILNFFYKVYTHTHKYIKVLFFKN